MVVRLLCLDLDGVVYKGSVVLPGAREAVEHALARGLLVRYVTNNSTTHREDVADRLSGMGLPAEVDSVLTSGFVAGQWLLARFQQRAPVMVVGEEGLVRELVEAGLSAFSAEEGGFGQPVAVVVGLDRSFSYRSLTRAQLAIEGGAVFVATNQDPVLPTPEGSLPGAGSLVAAVQTAAKTVPVVMGKPGLALAEILESSTGVPAVSTLLVGDSLATDIAMGRAAGMVTALVLTGVTDKQVLATARERPGDAPGSLMPDYVLPDLWGLPALLDRLGSPVGGEGG